MKVHHTQTNPHSEDSLFEAIASLRTSEEVQKFFRDLCTPTELQAMADRWLVVSAIKANKPYRQIYDETGVSVATVGRVARSLMFGEGGYHLVFARMEKKLKKNNCLREE